MRKIFMGTAIMAVFVCLIFGVLFLKGQLNSLQGLPSVKNAIAPEVDEVRIDEEYMNFYDLDAFETSLPVFFINTEGQKLSNEIATMGRCSVLNFEDDGNMHSIYDKPDISMNVGVKLRGASSYNFDKRQYRLTFFKDEYGTKKMDYDFFGMGYADSWVLNGPFLDKTLARNYMVYALGAEMMDWAPECKYVELFVDGRYKGVYLLIEPISVGPGRLDLSSYGLLSGKTAYIVSRDREGTDFDPLQNYGKLHGFTSNDLYVDYPGSKSITPAEYKWINDDISLFEMALYGEDYKDERLGYAEYIDVDNFVDYYILNEVVMNHDAGNLSTFAYKEINGKLKMVIWDFNNCYDNYQWFTEDFDEFYVAEMAWFNRLLTDRAFVDKVVSRYYELRQGTLSEEHMYSVLDEADTILGEAIDRNFSVWGYTFRKNLLVGSGRDIRSYDSAREQLRSSIEKRFEFLDEHITDLYELCEG
ncbi:MAG: hypothetical protein E7308_04245 [Butyrivibrio sp.]|nr:hypothetical protein [Butyrivibrio sp.]